MIAMGDVAVIGFSFKLPEGVDDVSSFWETLEKGRNLMTDWPASRISGNAFHNAELAKRNKVKTVTLQLFRMKFDVKLDIRPRGILHQRRSRDV
jgi:hypothetical protein